jgi:hypothetical protein
VGDNLVASSISFSIVCVSGASFKPVATANADARANGTTGEMMDWNFLHKPGVKSWLFI